MPTSNRSALKLKYLYGGVSHYRANEILGPRRIPDNEIFFMLEGTATYSANGQKYVATPGTLILPKPGFRETFRWAPYPRARLAYLHFNILRSPSDWPDAKRAGPCWSTTRPRSSGHSCSASSGNCRPYLRDLWQPPANI